jgi:hypothetical protein
MTGTYLKYENLGWMQWFKLVFLATQEAEIRQIMV